MEKNSGKKANRRTSKGRGKVVLVKFTADQCKTLGGKPRKECLAHRFPPHAEETFAQLYIGWTTSRFIAKPYRNAGDGDVSAWIRDFTRHGLIESERFTEHKMIKLKMETHESMESVWMSEMDSEDNGAFEPPKPISEEVEVSLRKKHHRIKASGLVSLVFKQDLRRFEVIEDAGSRSFEFIPDYPDDFFEKIAKKEMEEIPEEYANWQFDASRVEKNKKLLGLLAELFDTDEMRRDYGNRRNADIKAGKKQPINVVEWMRETLFNMWMLSYMLLRNSHNNAYSLFNTATAQSSYPANSVDKFRKKLKKVKFPLSGVRFLLACQLTDPEISSVLRAYYTDYHGLDKCWAEIVACGYAVKLGARSSR